ncbi:MAG: response regulator [Bacteroidetes bacterium]|jgi:phosphoserine phosphatase RsbU/P|nr:response regulator [Bacteroidota bacterium]MBT6687204.1 response regulator [Bacteroidota bacterium]MBT7144569.1 response regulator [Bacteroidota bacterium]MBT7490769.1 response regulator [Bacteroidota bacterium]
MKNLYDNTILIVDDTPENIDILVELLEDFNTKIAICGEDALEAAFEDPTPDIALLDIMMPGMDGYEVCRRLRANEKTKDIPVVFLTAKTQKQDIIKGFEAGGQDYLTKPFDSRELIERVKTQLELKEKTAFQIKAKNELAIQNQQITASIRYAHTLQSAFLPNNKKIEKYFDNYFILNKPKDIVSGDFYWLSHKNNNTYFSVSDCTGHGVPGALMSVLGITSLNEIINQYNDLSAAEILTHLRKIVISSLDQTNENNQTKDGIDMVVCKYNHETKVLQFAGANNPLYIIRNDELIVTKGDKMPVGIHANDKVDFTNNDFQMQKNDVIYMFSDGYVDQFGGEYNKKFKSKPFKNLLLEIHQKPMNQQKQILGQNIIDWMGNYEQIDDILVMGVKF